MIMYFCQDRIYATPQYGSSLEKKKNHFDNIILPFEVRNNDWKIILIKIILAFEVRNNDLLKSKTGI